MKQHLLLLLGTVCLSFTSPYAQNWVNGGNTLTANGSIGTNSSHSLLFETSGVERGRITNGGNWGIGSTGTSSRFTINTPTGVSPFRAQVNGSTKLVVNSNGGTSIGSSTAGPTDGLYVAGNVGIGIATPLTSYKLNVEGGIYGNYTSGTGITGNGFNGIYGYSNSSGGTGIQAYAGGSNGIALNAQSNFSYGIYARTANAASYAAYFQGRVFSTGGYTSSDRNLKKDIVDVSNAMDIINQLKPKSYQFRQDGNYKLMNLPQGKHYGLIAQDVELVLPGLVADADFNPARISQQVDGITATTGTVTQQSTDEIITFKAMNYTELIPIMVKAMQELKTQNDEQQQLIEQQQQQITRLKETVDKLLNLQGINTNSLTSAFLKTSIPNPAQGTALIQYYIPQNIRTANIVFTDLKGAIIKSISISNKGEGQINVNTAAWTAGTYTFTLYINGNQTDSKKLVIAR